MSKSLNAALRQLARAAACRWIAWLPFLFNIANFCCSCLCQCGWAPQPASTEFFGRSCIIMLGTGGSVCGSAGLWSQRGGFKTHIMLGSVAGLCSLVHCWVGTCSVNFCQTNIVVSVRDRVFVALWWFACSVKKLSNKHRYAGAC